MKKVKVILKLDLAEYEFEEVMHVIRNYDYKILDKEKYEEK